MKIRTDFVTNSSSSSFVSYRLNDSDFCRFVYQKMQEKDLDYVDSSEDFSLAGSDISFDENSLSAEINVGEYGVEAYFKEPEFDAHISAYDVVDDHVEDVDDRFWDDTYYESDEFADKILCEYNEGNSDNGYKEAHCPDYNYAFRLSDDFSAALYQLLSTHKHDETIMEYNGGFRCKPFSDADASFMDVYKDCMYVICNGSIEPSEEAKSVYPRMVNEFVNLISNFLPLDEIDEYDKVWELFEKDKANGKFSCDLYIGDTD